MLRRETIIALRARHTAFRIALDILYPPQPPPQSPTPIQAYDGDAPLGRVVVDREWADQIAEAADAADRRMAAYCLATVVVIFLIVIFGLYVKFTYFPPTPSAPPPVPVRPTAPR